MNITVFLLFFSFVFLQILRERGYIKIGYKEKQSQSYLSYLDGFPWRIFLLLRTGGLLPGVLGFSSVRHEPCPTTNFSLYLFSLTGRRCHFRFRVPANHLASTFFLPVSGDPLGLLDATPYPILYPSGHQVQTSVFPFWLGFVTLGLTHILSCFNGHSLMACQFKHGV